MNYHLYYFLALSHSCEQCIYYVSKIVVFPRRHPQLSMKPPVKSCGNTVLPVSWTWLYNEFKEINGKYDIKSAKASMRVQSLQ